jgi:protein tyrosine/serine phosphatase
VEAVRAHPAGRRVDPRLDPATGDPAARPAALERIAATDRRLAWDACLNVRDLGGLSCGAISLQRGRLVRASIIGTLTAAGREAMRAHGIRTVIDLRGDDEVADTPSPYRDGMTYLRIPFTSARIMALHIAAHGGTLPEELRGIAVPGGGLAEAVGALAEAEPGIVLHCTAGRDRTGIVVAAVLAAIGVPDEEIVADYVASDDALNEEYQRFKAANPDRAADVDEGIAKRAWVMEQVLATLRDAFGGGAAYLRSAGVRGEDLDAIRAKLLA